jgi:hypothetical protein
MRSIYFLQFQRNMFPPATPIRGGGGGAAVARGGGGGGGAGSASEAAAGGGGGRCPTRDDKFWPILKEEMGRVNDEFARGTRVYLMCATAYAFKHLRATRSREERINFNLDDFPHVDGMEQDLWDLGQQCLINHPGIEVRVGSKRRCRLIDWGLGVWCVCGVCSTVVAVAVVGVVGSTEGGSSVWASDDEVRPPSIHAPI